MTEALTEDQIATLLWVDNEEFAPGNLPERQEDVNEVPPEIMDQAVADSDEIPSINQEEVEEDENPTPMEDDSVQLGPSFVYGRNRFAWNCNIPTKRGRPLARNILLITPGPKHEAKHVKTPLESWQLLFTEFMINKIVLHTNQEIERQSSNYAANNYSVGPTNYAELKALFGLYYLAGVLRDGGKNTEDMWSPVYGNGLFRATMSMKRFLFLTDCLRFDDKLSRPGRVTNDKFTHIRDLWDLFITNCKHFYSPSAHVTIDEQLVPCRVRCPFLMYMPNKPGKYGIKIVMMNDAKTYYMCDALPYVGQITNRLEGELVPEYYIRKLTETIYGSRRNITCDNWFTTIPLVDKMLQNHSLTMVGTLNKGKPHMFLCSLLTDQ